MYDTLLILLRTTLVLTLCGGVCFFALRKIEARSPRLSRLLWLAVLLTGWFWLQPVLQIPMEVRTFKEPGTERSAVPGLTREWSSESSGGESGDYAEYRSVPGSLKPAIFESSMLIPAQKFDWTPYILPTIFAVWLGGMVVTIFLMTVNYLRILLLLQKMKPAEDVLSASWEALLTQHGIDSKAIPMLLSQNLGPALVCTPWGYRLVVPEEFWSELSESGRRGILKHELAHFRRSDVWKSFFVRILTLPHWFNPVAHYAANRFDELAEQLCDQEAFTSKQEGIAEYARVLMLLHDNAPTQFVARQSIFGRDLQKRVAFLLEETPLRRISTMKKTLLIFATVIMLLVALFRVEFVTITISAQEPGTERYSAQSPDDSQVNPSAQSPDDSQVNPSAQSPDDSQVNPGTTASTPMSPALLGSFLWTSVIDAETQKPFAGVKATLYFAKPGGREIDTRTTQSDEQGRIFFPLPSELNADEEAGTRVLVEKEGYVSEHNGRQAKWAEIVIKDERLVCEVFQLQKAETITGRIVDEQGKPLAGVLVAVFRDKLRAYIVDGWRTLISYEFKTDADGRFRFDVAKGEKVVLWALPENLAPQYVFPDTNRGDLGDIRVNKGFEPVVTVLDKDGKPVPDVWVNLGRTDEYFRMSSMSAYARSAVTDQEGKARFRPISEGKFEIRVSERPRERFYESWSDEATTGVTWRAREGENNKPVKGVYSITPVQLSSTSSQVTLQAENTVRIDVQFSDKTTDSLRDLNTNITGGQSDNRFFAARPSSGSPSAHQGNGLFSFQVPVGLEKAMLGVHSDTETAYRAKIDGESDWLEDDRVRDFSLGTIEKPMKIEVTAYKSPKITLNVVDESGQPIKEYYAWMEYTKHGTPAAIKVDGDKIRVDITPERWNEITWEWATSKLPLGGILDVSFTYKNFGQSETKINAGGILPDEEMRLHIVTRDYALAKQMIPKMAEGEEREMTIALKK